MNSKQLLGKRIKEIRKQCGFTQESLSVAINIDTTTLSGIESGRHYPSLVTLEKIAQKLNVALVTLFDFNVHLSIEEMKTVISNNINNLSDDDIKFIYRIINKKYIENIYPKCD